MLNPENLDRMCFDLFGNNPPALRIFRAPSARIYPILTNFSRAFGAHLPRLHNFSRGFGMHTHKFFRAFKLGTNNLV